MKDQKVGQAVQVFEVGDAVKWTSTSNGSTIEKRGKVIQVIEPKANPHKQFDQLERQGYRSMWGGGCPRDHQSYIVAVGQGEEKAVLVYWPRVRGLVRAGPGEQVCPHCGGQLKGKRRVSQAERLMGSEYMLIALEYTRLYAIDDESKEFYRKAIPLAKRLNRAMETNPKGTEG